MVQELFRALPPNLDLPLQPVETSFNMGRTPQVATCPVCKTTSVTKLEFVAGPRSFCCCCMMTQLAPLLLLGHPKGIRRDCWDVEHYCPNCNRKLGYNVLCPKVCCGPCVCVAEAFNMPQDGIGPAE